MTKATGINRSLYYYHTEAEEAGDSKGKRGRPVPGYSFTTTRVRIPDKQMEEYLMEAVEGDGATYGIKNLTHFLKVNHHIKINHKKVGRLCRKLGLLLPQRKGNPTYPKRLVRNRIITAPNQLWQVDIKYGMISETRRFFFVACAIDVLDRSIVGHYRGQRCTAKDITTMLEEALFRRGVSTPPSGENQLIIRTDNGPQFVSNLFGAFCEGHHLLHERIPPRSPNYNAYIESFFSIMERDLFRRFEFEYFEEAYYEVDEFMTFYNERRFHGSLKRMAPLQFHETYRETGYPVDMNIRL